MKLINLIILLLLTAACATNPQQDPLKRYDRSDWGRWVDPDGNCLNTRHELLKARSLTRPEIKKCKVVSGTWKDYYYNKTLHKPSLIDIDHIVPVKHAYTHGGHKWNKSEKRNFYNDFENLVITNKRYNRQKGDKDFTEWMPVDQSYACKYAKKWFGIKKKYMLNISNQEETFLKKLDCH